MAIGWNGMAARAARVVAAVVLAAGLGLASGSMATGQTTAPVVWRQGGDTDPVGSGALELVSKDSSVARAVAQGTDVSIEVNGPVVRTTVTQAFRNNTREWVEARYLYPLPEDSAVDSLKMVVGKRVIIGQIKEREEARLIYEAARDNGQAAGLVEQQRPNMFTTSVANVGPGQTVLIQIQYQGVVRQSGGIYSLRVPMVVGPRYSSNAVTDSAAISAPLASRREPGNPVTLSVRLKAGFPVEAVQGSYHGLARRDEGAKGLLLTLADGAVAADRDFELTWKAAGKAPTASLFQERIGKGRYVLAMLAPPQLPVAAGGTDRPARDVVFVIDNSGSMSGESMDQAKASLVYGLSRLGPRDRFNVVRFDDTLEVLFRGPVAADARNLKRATEFVQGLEANGGTEMLPALNAALKVAPSQDGRLRQIVFLTDGEIGDEQGMLNRVAADHGRSRIFMVGIGSAPNSYLMTRMAEMGRGSFTHIGDTAEVQGRMAELLDKLQSPVVTDLTATFTAGGADVAPALLPDLYAGEPIVLSARVKSMSGEVVLTGKLGGRPWSTRLPLSGAVQAKGVSRLWARRKIADIEVRRILGTIDGDLADKQVIAFALRHDLVTNLTSLVAVDRTPIRPAGEALRQEDIPLNLPKGWSFDGLFGGQSADATPAKGDASQADQGVELPETATDYPLQLLIGLGLLLAAAGVAGFRRRAAS